MLLRPISRPWFQRTQVLTGLKYWWPCDDATGQGRLIEVVQGAHATAANSPRQLVYWGRVPVTGNQVRGTVGAPGAAGACYNVPTITVPAPIFTLSCKVRQTGATGAGNYGQIFGQFGGAGTRFQLMIKNLGQWVWETSNTFADPGANGPGNNVWTHIVWLYDGSNFLLIQNGVTISTNAGTSNPAAFSASGIQIGQGGTSSYPGVMRDIRLYNRAISVVEARMIYAEDFVPPPDTADLAMMAAYATGNSERWLAGSGQGLNWGNAFSSATLNSIASGNAILSDVVITNGTSLDLAADLSISFSNVTVAAPACVGVYAYPLNQDATTYGDGRFGTAAAGPPSPQYYVGNITIPTGTGTALVGTLKGIPIPTGSFKFVLHNQLGTTLASSGNVCLYRTYNKQYPS